MPIEVGIWKLDESLQRVKAVSMDSESRLTAAMVAAIFNGAAA